MQSEYASIALKRLPINSPRFKTHILITALRPY